MLRCRQSLVNAGQTRNKHLYRASQDGVLDVPAENVYAVFDVKQRFCNDKLKQAVEKAESCAA